jgi:hypothetical protein
MRQQPASALRLTMVMVLAGSAARAAPMDVDTCHSIKLPAPISDTIANQFSGWQVVTSADLVDPGDRAFWKENLPKECPGIIAGRFRTRQLDYAISLIKRNVDSSEQQILVFEAEKVGFKILVLEHPTRESRCDQASFRDTGRRLQEIAVGDARNIVRAMKDDQRPEVSPAVDEHETANQAESRPNLETFKTTIAVRERKYRRLQGDGYRPGKPTEVKHLGEPIHDDAAIDELLDESRHE